MEEVALMDKFQKTTPASASERSKFQRARPTFNSTSVRRNKCRMSIPMLGLQNITAFINMLQNKMRRFNFIKPAQATNFISRILFLNYHLSAINITVYLLLPTPCPPAVCTATNEPFLKSTIRGITASGLPMLCIAAWHRELLPHIFTLTLAPLQATAAVIFCGTLCSRKRTRLLTGGLPCAVRTFLSFKRTIAQVGGGCKYKLIVMVTIILREQ